MQLYLRGKEDIVDTQRWREGAILTQRMIFIFQRLLHDLLHHHSLRDMMLSIRKENFYGFP